MDSTQRLRDLLEAAKNDADAMASIPCKSGEIQCEWNGGLPFISFQHMAAGGPVAVSTESALSWLDE